MGRRRSPKKVEAEAKRRLARKPPKSAGAKVRDLEWRLAKSLEREKAAGEILRVISSSPASVQPTFEAITRAAMSLCEADIGSLFRFDGRLIHFGAFHGTPAEVAASRLAFPQRPSHDSVTARAILAATVVQVDDVSHDPEVADALRAFRTVLSVPMIRDGRPLGAITVARRVVRPFSDEQIALLKTFADQAVIAIENVRLFTELGARNKDLTESLERQTATAEILRIISGAQTDVQPVFDTIVASAVRLCRAHIGAVFQYDGARLHLVAHCNFTPGMLEAIRRVHPRAPQRDMISGRAILSRGVVQIDDVLADREYSQDVALTTGWRSMVALPMLREGDPIGAIVINRIEPGPFSDNQVDLLRSFADQAVIAIENVRLFNQLEASNREIGEKSRQVEIASRHKSEFLANMSHELRTPLNAIIGYSELLEEEAGDLDGGWLVPDLQKIATAAKHQLSLINDILDLSKVEAGRMELELSDFDLPTALDSALTLVRERAGRRGIALHMEVDSRLGPVRADERKVRQVVLNLLSNAIKFTPEGGRIEVRAARRDGSVEVSVSDTGIGIAPEDQEKVFEEFRQVGTADKKVEGTGLGLALARKFVELHGGRMWVTSRLGEGATFTFTWPTEGG